MQWISMAPDCESPIPSRQDRRPAVSGMGRPSAL